ncbi:MAG: cation:proton antiporter [Euryarchaeota archaeon]|nr:cation:proton antiporter [Euryarchaeota archaeon]
MAFNHNVEDNILIGVIGPPALLGSPYFRGPLWLILGLSLLDSAFLGTALASSSTAIIAKVLADMGKLHERSASIMLGVLVVEDLVVVLLLAMLQSYLSVGSFGMWFIGWEILKIILFIGGALAVGTLVIPRIIDRVAGIRRLEVLVIISVGLVFGLAFLGNVLGFSFAIGAFIMGVCIAPAKSVHKVAHGTRRLKDIFGAIFFVSVGALINVGEFAGFLVPAVLITIGMFCGKLGGVRLGMRLFGHGRVMSLRVGPGMAQIGEFAFIVMQVGLGAGAVDARLYPAIGVAVLVTTFLTPYMLRIGYGMKDASPQAVP